MKYLNIKTVITFCYIFSAACSAAQENDFLMQYRNMVLEYNQDIKSAEYKSGMMLEQQKSAKADFFPSLSGNANFKYTGNPAELSLTMPGSENPLHFQGRDMKYGADLTLAQPVYAGGAIKAGYDRAKKESEMAMHEQNLVTDRIIFNADVFYWNKVARAEMTSVARNYMNSIAELTEVVKNRVEEGFTDRSDLLMTEVKLNDAMYRLLQAENEAEKARMALNTFSGQPFDVQIPTDTMVTPVPEIYMMNGNIDEITGQRPEVMIAQNRVDIQKSSAKIANSRYLPKVSVGISGSYSAPGYDFQPDMDPNYAVYAKLSIPIFDWGKRKNTRKAGKYSVSIMEENRSKVSDNVRLEINTALYDYQQAVKKTELTGNSLQKAEENERMATDKYKEGNISIIEVINAKLYYQEARVNHIQSKLNARIAKSTLDRATGEINKK